MIAVPWQVKSLGIGVAIGAQALEHDRTSAQGGLNADLAAFDAWWREAGLDHDYGDEPVSWLAEPEPETQKVVASARPAPAKPEPVAKAILGGERAAWPEELSGFSDWWLNEPSLAALSTRPSISPRGVPGADLMVLVPQPEIGDADSLLSGPQGTLLANFLAAAGIAGERIYLAAALPAFDSSPDWPALADAGLGAIVARHIALAAPKRLIVFGANILPLLGHDPAKNPADLRTFNHEGGSVPVLPVGELATMLDRPAAKAALWRRWQEWSRGT